MSILIPENPSGREVEACRHVSGDTAKSPQTTSLSLISVCQPLFYPLRWGGRQCIH
ncbi:hypothetical protein J6590_029480 [Homalodisca vitripennis]|nr:hypothetical protein J6590_029480 [Homalodisca vitripennis]